LIAILYFSPRMADMSACAEYYGDFRVHVELCTPSKSYNRFGRYVIK
jgi:hypothetical protein